MKHPYVKQLLQTENEQLKRLHEIVAKSLEEEKLLTQKLYQEKDLKLTFAEALADQVAAFGGSWTFILSFLFFILVWILANLYWLANQGFDPYPFILLNLILSSLSAFQAPVIMMSQNRQEAKDRRRAENDYLTNLKAELEIRGLHEKIDLLMVDQMKTLLEIQKRQLDSLERLEKTASHSR